MTSVVGEGRSLLAQRPPSARCSCQRYGERLRRWTIGVERAARFAEVLGYSVNPFVTMAVEEQLLKAGLKVRVHLEAA